MEPWYCVCERGREGGREGDGGGREGGREGEGEREGRKRVGCREKRGGKKNREVQDETYSAVWALQLFHIHTSEMQLTNHAHTQQLPANVVHVHCTYKVAGFLQGVWFVSVVLSPPRTGR